MYKRQSLDWNVGGRSKVSTRNPALPIVFPPSISFSLRLTALETICNATSAFVDLHVGPVLGLVDSGLA